MSRVQATCLESALVRQRWLAAHGDRRDIVIGVSPSGLRDNPAHAWVDGTDSRAASSYLELHRLKGMTLARSEMSDRSVAVSETLQLDNSRVTWRVVEDEAIAIDLESAQYLSINSSGVGLLERLANGTTYEEMSEHLQAEFGIDRETADRDARAFVASLRELGLVASESPD